MTVASVVLRLACRSSNSGKSVADREAFENAHLSQNSARQPAHDVLLKFGRTPCTWPDSTLVRFWVRESEREAFSQLLRMRPSLISRAGPDPRLGGPRTDTLRPKTDPSPDRIEVYPAE